MLSKNVFSQTGQIQNNITTIGLGFNVAFGLIDSKTFKSIEGIENVGSFSVISYTYGNQTAKQNVTFQKCRQEDKQDFFKPEPVS